MFTGDVDVITATDDDHVYEITRKENAQVLYVRDITEYAVLKNALNLMVLWLVYYN